MVRDFLQAGSAGAGAAGRSSSAGAAGLDEQEVGWKTGVLVPLRSMRLPRGHAAPAAPKTARAPLSPRPPRAGRVLVLLPVPDLVCLGPHERPPGPQGAPAPPPAPARAGPAASLPPPPGRRARARARAQWLVVMSNVSSTVSVVAFGLASSFGAAVVARLAGGLLNCTFVCLKSMCGEAGGSAAGQARAMTLLSLAWGVGTGALGWPASPLPAGVACALHEQQRSASGRRSGGCRCAC